jgi:hypothetical protein
MVSKPFFWGGTPARKPAEKKVKKVITKTSKNLSIFACQAPKYQNPLECNNIRLAF